MVGVGHCIYCRHVYMWRGGGCKEGEGCAQPGGFWGIQLFIRRPSTEMGVGGLVEKVGYRHQKHVHMTSQDP